MSKFKYNTRPFLINGLVFLVFSLIWIGCDKGEKKITINRDYIQFSDHQISSKQWVFDKKNNDLYFSEGKYIKKVNVSDSQISKVFNTNMELVSFNRLENGLTAVSQGHSSNVFIITENGETFKANSDERYYKINPWKSPILHYDKYLSATRFPRNVQRLDVPEQKTEFIISITDSTDCISYKVYPRSYYSKDFHLIGLEYSKSNDKDKLYFSFPCDHSLSIFKQGSKIDSIYAPSKFLVNYNFPEFNESSEDYIQSKIDYVTTTGRYGKLVFLEKYNCLARIVINPQQFKTKDGFTDSQTNSMSIQIIDLDSEELYEYRLNEKYKYSTLIPYEKGVLLQNENNKPKTVFSYLDFSKLM